MQLEIDEKYFIKYKETFNCSFDKDFLKSFVECTYSHSMHRMDEGKLYIFSDINSGGVIVLRESQINPQTIDKNINKLYKWWFNYASSADWHISDLDEIENSQKYFPESWV